MSFEFDHGINLAMIFHLMTEVDHEASEAKAYILVSEGACAHESEGISSFQSGISAIRLQKPPTNKPIAQTP